MTDEATELLSNYYKMQRQRGEKCEMGRKTVRMLESLIRYILIRILIFHLILIGWIAGFLLYLIQSSSLPFPSCTCFR